MQTDASPTDTSGALLWLKPHAQILTSDRTVKLDFDVMIENTDGSLVENVYGVAFSLSFDQPAVEQPTLSTDSSWMADARQLVLHHTMVPQTTAANPQTSAFLNQTDFGMVNNSFNHISGSGMIASTGIIVSIDDITDDPDLMGYTSFNVGISNIILIDRFGNPLPVSNLSTNNIITVKIPLEDISSQDMSLQTTQTTTTGLAQSLQVFPNPAKDQVQIEFHAEDTRKTSLSVMDAVGKLLLSQHLDTHPGLNSFTKDLSAFPAGLYYLQLETATERVVYKIWLLP